MTHSILANRFMKNNYSSSKSITKLIISLSGHEMAFKQRICAMYLMIINKYVRLEWMMAKQLNSKI